MASRIARIEAWRCPLPMAHELRLGAITYANREVVVLRIETKDGFQGAAMGYSRGTPMLESLRTLAAQLSGLPTDEPRKVALLLRRRFAPGWGAMVRAASLIDIALWDIAARRSDAPLSSFLGGAERETPLMVVAGYFLDQRGRGAIVDEVRLFLDDGYETIKLIVPGHDLAADLALVADVHAEVRGQARLAIDFHGAFDTANSAIAYCRPFDDLGLRFIEDPFPSYDSDEVCAVASAMSTPIAAGEDLISVASYRILLNGGTRYLRVDATATGGYSAALQGIAASEAVGATVAPHVWPHIHQPLAGRSQTVGMIEIIPHSTGADPVDLLLDEPFPIRDGRWATPIQPGLYLPLNWSKVETFSDLHWTEEW